jgi:hypothetical protein
MLSNQPLPQGLNVVRRLSTDKGVMHFAILDVGNTAFGLPSAALLWELAPSGLHARVYDSREGWVGAVRIADQLGAIERLRRIHSSDTSIRYDLFTNNCEHFASHIAEGRRQSPQVAVFISLCGAVAIGLLVASSARPALSR